MASTASCVVLDGTRLRRNRIVVLVYVHRGGRTAVAADPVGLAREG